MQSLFEKLIFTTHVLQSTIDFEEPRCDTADIGSTHQSNLSPVRSDSSSALPPVTYLHGPVATTIQPAFVLQSRSCEMRIAESALCS